MKTHGCSYILGIIIHFCLLVTGLAAKPNTMECPKDTDLIKLIYEKQDDLKKVSLMLKDDEGKVRYIGDDTIRAENISKPRQAEYLRLMKRLGEGLTVRAGEKEIWISFWNNGGLSVGSESEKGIVYLPDIKRRKYTIKENLDSLDTNFGDGVFVRLIENEWYIMYINSS